VAFFEDAGVRIVTPDVLAARGEPDRLLANINTPLDYRAIEADGTQS
jgi:hypothetical protein